MTTPEKPQQSATPPSEPNDPEVSSSRIERLTAWAKARMDYVMTGVWRDPRRSWKVTVVKTLNLGIRSFTDSDLQVRAAALTYNTVLAVVPVLALLFAITRGFGFQTLLEDEVYKWFPAQHQAITAGLKFVDRYLEQASEGIFVGVGLVFLLWTMISLLSNVEDAFNIIWDVKHGRTFWRKVTDYLAIFLVLPILMICAAGLSLFMSNTISSLFSFMTPVVSVFVDIGSFVFTWLFFAVAYMLIPNVKVKFVNAFIAGALAGTSFQVLQWLFLSGQLYVSKYNAIYGSFSFLPLMMVWLYLTWLITLIGAVLCYASQNIFALSFIGQIDAISLTYRRKVTVVIMALICRRFNAGMPPLSVNGLASTYALPARLVKDEVERLVQCSLLNYVEIPDKEDEPPVQPAVPVERLTVGTVIARLNARGDSDFIPLFNERYGAISKLLEKIEHEAFSEGQKVLFIDLPANIEPLPVGVTPR
ncbi:MAG: YihY/virulence factor BrkB family protein [Candidatus Amulumruptor caecigallinarius]|nr:YihY/virulence factor BrkB family protein [Candidatus Amulumruptor caecigallinarius]MCM1396707.1 YihY/virulence factor BrkB family protein [Candidatus Amulumruptor caecigallinarius]MCM1453235.1 YihY/virulence factor BrkB family protein [bacterium]